SLRTSASSSSMRSSRQSRPMTGETYPLRLPAQADELLRLDHGSVRPVISYLASKAQLFDASGVLIDARELLVDVTQSLCCVAEVLSNVAQALSRVEEVLSDVAQSLCCVAEVLVDATQALSRVAEVLIDATQALCCVAEVLIDATQALSRVAEQLVHAAEVRDTANLSKGLGWHRWRVRSAALPAARPDKTERLREVSFSRSQSGRGDSNARPL